MVTITIPEPALVCLVAPAGAGKSTLAARLFAPDEVVSSDGLRAAIAGDATDQRATAAAFGALHRAVARRLRERRLTVVDATSVERRARRRLVRLADDARVPAVAVVLDLPRAVVLDRNAARAERVVPPDVVRRHLAMLRRAVDRDAFSTEGWDLVVRLREPLQADRLAVARRRPAGAASGGQARAVTSPNRRARSSTQTPLRR